MMLTAWPCSRPRPMSPEAMRATSSPKLRAETATQELPSGDLRSMIVDCGSRSMRSASSHGTVQEESGSVMRLLVATPSSMKGLPATDTRGWPEEDRGLTGTLCQVGRGGQAAPTDRSDTQSWRNSRRMFSSIVASHRGGARRGAHSSSGPGARTGPP